MIEFLVEIIVEVILFFILSCPGAFVRWGFNGFKKGKLDTYLKKDAVVNALIFIAFILGIFLIVKLLF